MTTLLVGPAFDGAVLQLSWRAPHPVHMLTGLGRRRELEATARLAAQVNLSAVSLASFLTAGRYRWGPPPVPTATSFVP